MSGGGAGWLLAGTLLAASTAPEPELEFLEFLALEADSEWSEFFDDFPAEIAGQVAPEPPSEEHEDED